MVARLFTLATPIFSIFDGLERAWHWLIDSKEVPHGKSDLVKQQLSPSNRTIDYWAENGHFFRWNYRHDQIQSLQRHVGNIAADPTIEFNWHDAARVNEMIRIMESSIEGRDAAL